MRLPMPEGLRRRLQPMIERGERFLRGWEWTWTSAVVASVVIAFFSMTMLAVVPSWWLYFANQTLHWDQGPHAFWLSKLRDAFAAGWITVWFGIIFVTAYILQTIRRRVRGEGGETRPTGGYR
jgi:hypothetical protein